MTEVDWVDALPEPTRGRNGIWEERLEPLRVRPGHWARIAKSKSATSAAVTANNLRKGRNRIPWGRWEFASRGEYIFARYLGGDE